MSKTRNRRKLLAAQKAARKARAKQDVRQLRSARGVRGEPPVAPPPATGSNVYLDAAAAAGGLILVAIYGYLVVRQFCPGFECLGF